MRSGCAEDLHYAGNFASILEPREDLKNKLEDWKGALSLIGLRVSIKNDNENQ